MRNIWIRFWTWMSSWSAFTLLCTQMIQWQEQSLSEFLGALPALSQRERMFTTGKLETTIQPCYLKLLRETRNSLRWQRFKIANRNWLKKQWCPMENDLSSRQWEIWDNWVLESKAQLIVPDKKGSQEVQPTCIYNGKLLNIWWGPYLLIHFSSLSALCF